MSQPEKVDFESLRQAFFIDSRNPLEQGFRSAFLSSADNLLGTYGASKEVLLSGRDDLFLEFAKNLGKEFSTSRVFDYRSIGQIHPSNFAPAILAHISSTFRNNNTIVSEVSPVETKMEEEVINWLASKIALYDIENSSGALVGGGTSANLTSLMVAREKIEQKGWKGEYPVAILTSGMSHYSVQKAARMLGPGNLIRVENIPYENNGLKMDLAYLESRLNDERELPIMAIVATAGQTETGLVERIGTIADIIDERFHFHIDAAYGGPFVLSKRRPMFEGIERSDSLTVDPHKYMYTPYSAGAVLFRNFRDHQLIACANGHGDAYLFKEGTGQYLGGRRIEGSMGGQGAASTWSVINTLGEIGLGVVLDHAIDITDYTYSILEKSSVFRPIFEPELTTVCFLPDNLQGEKEVGNSEVRLKQIEIARKRLEDETEIYISTTDLPVHDDLSGYTKVSRVFRVVITNPYTEKMHIEQMLSSLEKIWAEVLSVGN